MRKSQNKYQFYIIFLSRHLKWIKFLSFFQSGETRMREDSRLIIISRRFPRTSKIGVISMAFFSNDCMLVEMLVLRDESEKLSSVNFSSKSPASNLRLLSDTLDCSRSFVFEEVLEVVIPQLPSTKLSQGRTRTNIDCAFKSFMFFTNFPFDLKILQIYWKRKFKLF